MAVGFNVGGTLGNVVPDRTMTRTSAPKVLRASFGDGYEQRVANGINSIEEKYSILWTFLMEKLELQSFLSHYPTQITLLTQESILYK